MKQRAKIFVAALLLATPTLLPFSFSGDNGERSKSFNVNKGGMLEVNVDGGAISIKVWDKNEVFVRAEGIDEDEMDRLKMTQSGNTVRIEFKHQRWGWSSGRSRFDITMPSQFDTDLHTSGGDIEIHGSVSGRIKGSTSGGDVTIENVLKGGIVDLSTSGGNMRAGNVEGDVKLRTSGGDIELGKVSGEVSVSTSGGNIIVESVGKTLKASTSGGDIEIGDIGGEARVATSGGNIRIKKVSGSASMGTSGGNIDLESASGNVIANTSGGDINLDNITGSVEASTSGGEVVAKLNPIGGKGRSKLKSSGGEIKLYIPENAKATIEAVINIHGRWRSRGRDEYEIRSDFKPEMSTRDGDHGEIRELYKLNGGGEEIYLETTESNIQIRKWKK